MSGISLTAMVLVTFISLFQDVHLYLVDSHTAYKYIQSKRKIINQAGQK